METGTGGETGGEWMSVAQGDEPHIGMVATVGIGGSAFTGTSPRGLELTSDDELLIAVRRSGAVIV